MVDVAIVLGSQSDEKILEKSEILDFFKTLDITFERSVLSAHRHPEELRKYCLETKAKIFIAGAGRSAALPGVIAGWRFDAVVIAVAFTSTFAGGLDSILSIVRLPSGVPAMLAGDDKAGLKNAALCAANILALSNPDLEDRLRADWGLRKIKKPPEIKKEVWDGKNTDGN